jgi:hypothetical protein
MGVEWAERGRPRCPPTPPPHSLDSAAHTARDEIRNERKFSIRGPHASERGIPSLPTLTHPTPRPALAGMTVEERSLIETAFRDKPLSEAVAQGEGRAPLSVLFATSTVAQGVNLPARRVIFLHTHCDVPVPFLDVSKYRQMAGRAGRAGQDSVGEVFLLSRRVHCSVGPGGRLNETTGDGTSRGQLLRLMPVPPDGAKKGGAPPPPFPALAGLPRASLFELPCPLPPSSTLVAYMHPDVARVAARAAAYASSSVPGHAPTPLDPYVDDTEVDLAFRLLHDPLPPVRSSLLRPFASWEGCGGAPPGGDLGVPLQRLVLELIVAGLLRDVASWGLLEGEGEEATYLRLLDAPLPSTPEKDPSLAAVLRCSLLYRDLRGEGRTDASALAALSPLLHCALAALQHDNFLLAMPATPLLAAPSPALYHVRLVPTALGRAAVASSLDPASAFTALSELVRARTGGIVLDDEAHAIFLLTHGTMLGGGEGSARFFERGEDRADGKAAPSLRLVLERAWAEHLGTHGKGADTARSTGGASVASSGSTPAPAPAGPEQHLSSLVRTAELLGVTRSGFLELASTAYGVNSPSSSLHRRWLATLVLRDLVRGRDPAAVRTFYGLQSGAMAQLQSNVAMYAGQLKALAMELGWGDIVLLIASYAPRLEWGITPELLELLALAGEEPPLGTPTMNCARARALYDGGFRSVAALAGMDAEEARGEGRGKWGRGGFEPDSRLVAQEGLVYVALQAHVLAKVRVRAAEVTLPGAGVSAGAAAELEVRALDAHLRGVAKELVRAARAYTRAAGAGGGE